MSSWRLRLSFSARVLLKRRASCAGESLLASWMPFGGLKGRGMSVGTGMGGGMLGEFGMVAGEDDGMGGDGIAEGHSGGRG